MSPETEGDEHSEVLMDLVRDPIRRRILSILGDRPEGATIAQVASRLKEPPRRIRHYMGALVEAGVVVVKSERPRRGTIERLYRSLAFPLVFGNDWAEEFTPEEMKRTIFEGLRLTFEEVTSAITAGTFVNRSGWCSARLWHQVDEQGWQELADIHERALREVISVTEEASERLAQSDADPIPMVSALYLFEALPWDE